MCFIRCFNGLHDLLSYCSIALLLLNFWIRSRGCRLFVFFISYSSGSIISATLTDNCCNWSKKSHAQLIEWNKQLIEYQTQLIENVTSTTDETHNWSKKSHAQLIEWNTQLSECQTQLIEKITCTNEWILGSNNGISGTTDWKQSDMGNWSNRNFNSTHFWPCLQKYSIKQAELTDETRTLCRDYDKKGHVHVWQSPAKK